MTEMAEETVPSRGNVIPPVLGLGVTPPIEEWREEIGEFFCGCKRVMRGGFTPSGDRAPGYDTHQWCPLHAKARALYDALKAFKSEYPTILTETEVEWRACNYCNHSYPPGKDKHNEGCPWGTAQALLKEIDNG